MDLLPQPHPHASGFAGPRDLDRQIRASLSDARAGRLPPRQRRSPAEPATRSPGSTPWPRAVGPARADGRRCTR
jgi:hypothetical protein